MIEPPKILYICSWYPNRVHPYNGNFIEKHVRCLRGHYPTWVVQVEEDFSLARGHYEDVCREEKDMTVYQVYFRPRWTWAKQLIKYKHYLRAARICRNQAGYFSLIHVHVMFPALFPAYWLSWLWRLPMVISEHSWAFLPGSPYAYPFIVEWLLIRMANAARAVCPVSDLTAAHLQKLGLKAPCIPVPNVVSSQLFYPASQPLPHFPFRFLHISNFDPRAKNVGGILSAFKQLVQHTSQQVHLTLAGDGALEPWRQMARELGILHRVSLQGPLSEHEVGALMRGHHAFILFSDWETQPVVLIESQLCGLPCLTTAVGGIQEIITEPGQGILMDAANEAQLTKAMYTMMASYTSYSPKYIASRAQRYTEPVIAQQLKVIYALEGAKNISE